MIILIVVAITMILLAVL